MGFDTEIHTVTAIVDQGKYSPYGDLSKYLKNEGFDMIEIDTVSLTDILGLIVDTKYCLFHTIRKRYLQHKERCTIYRFLKGV